MSDELPNALVTEAHRKLAPLVAFACYGGPFEDGKEAEELIPLSEETKAAQLIANSERDAVRKETGVLRELLQSFVENDTTPPPNCGCHISPPCSDCTEFAAMRELVASAKKQLGL